MSTENVQTPAPTSLDRGEIVEEQPKKNSADRGLFQRPKNSGIWWIRYHDESGREHREKIGRSKTLARKAYQKRKTEIQEKRFFPERIRRREILVADYIEKYLSIHVRGRLRNEKHCERYGRIWKAWLRGRTVREVTPSDIERFQNHRKNVDGLAVASVNREVSFLKAMYSFAVKNGEAETNPAKEVDFFKEPKGRDRYLTDEEESRLREEIGEEHWPKVVAAMYTAMRRANVFRLRWADIDFETRLIAVRKTKSDEDYYVPMNDELLSTLRCLPSRLRSEWVFPSETGNTPLDPNNFISRVFTPAMKRAEIANFHWHDLRHTFGSRLAMAEKPVGQRTIQELMNHSSSKMTERYTHLSAAHKLAAVQQLNPKPTGTRTGTGRKGIKAVRAGSVERSENRGVIGGDGWTRTTDLGIMRPSL